jgi:hypothetical protein
VFLLHELHIMRWGASWPIFLIVAGVLLMVRHSLGGTFRPMPPHPPQAPPASPPVTPVSSTGIVPSPGTVRDGSDTSNQGGR